MSHPDTSSAEWIAEAPSTTSQSAGDQVLPLADFGKVTFTCASATADGHTGSISDPNLNAEQVQLSPTGTARGPEAGGSFTPAELAGGSQSSSGASTSNLSSDESLFSVSYTSNTSSAQSSTGGPGVGWLPELRRLRGGGLGPGDEGPSCPPAGSGK